MSNQLSKGVEWYLPTIEEHMAFLGVRSARTSKTNEKKTGVKTVKMEEQEKKTTGLVKNKILKTVKM